MKLFTREYLSFNQELKEEWLELEYRSNISMFQNYHWNLYWYNNNKENKKNRLRIISIKDESSQTVAIFPCVVNYTNGFSILRFCGYNISDYGMPLIDKKIKTNQIFKKIFNTFIKYNEDCDLLYLDNLPNNYNNNNIFFPKIIKTKKKFNSYRMNTSKLENKISVIPRKNRDTKRKINKLNLIGKLDYCHENNQKKFKKLIDKLIIFKNERIKEQGQRDIFKNPDIYKFYKEIENAELGSIKIILSVLYLDNKEIAITFGALFRDTYYYIMPTFSSRYQKYSSGKILLQNQIEKLLDKNIIFFDFTIGDESYKKLYSNEVMEIYEFMYSKKIKGMIYIKINNLVKYMISFKKIKSILIFFRKIIN
tara:strand:+ start:14929 stop:16026 length:1098 start_codon:yes stop_codon:yes gene_type:complete